MEVTFALNKETLEALKDAFTRDLAVYEGVVKDIKSNLDRIDRALGIPKSMYCKVRSDSNPDKMYTVRRTSNGEGGFYTYVCSCPSYQYERGLDEGHRCKHIRKAVYDSPFTVWV